jgi:hypothetical protein
MIIGSRRLYRWGDRMPRFSLALGLLFGVALAGLASAQSTTDFDGQYVGKLTLTKLLAGDCTEPPLGALYPLAVAGGRVEFKYLPRFDTILRGRVAADGTFTAQHRLRRGRIRMTGHIEGTDITATITSPSCIYIFRTGN